MKASPLNQPTLLPRADLPGWTYHADLQVRNNATAVLLSGYTVTLNLDTAALISQGRLLLNCDDLRITFNGGAEQELDRLVSGCNTTTTVVTFRTQEAIDPDTVDPRYTLYYGNPSAGAPPVNPANIYAFSDDFQDGDASGWTVTKGTWAVVNDGGNFIYRYSGDGANWPLSYAAVPLSDLDYTARIRATDSPMTNWIGLAFRISDPSTFPDFLTFYQSRDQSIFKYGVVTNDNHTNPLSSQPGFTMLAGSWYRLRVQAVGSTVRARIWADGAIEPTTWSPTTSTTTYQTSTNIGLTLYYHPTSADWDDIQVRRLATVEPTVKVWWNTDYKYSRQVTVTNTSTTASLQLKYSIRYTLDTAALIGNGQMQADCDDLRMVAAPGLIPVEIDRVVENCNSTQTVVWFALQRPVNASGQDMAYTLYYGNSTASTPPANGMKVFLFFEDWEQGTTHWITAGGLDAGNPGTMGASTISTEQSLSLTHSQRMGSFGSGGDGKSGSIPVSPSTDYALSVWGRSTNPNVCGPLGFDFYTTVGGGGTETWLWTSEWRIGPAWVWNSQNFTTTAATNFLKIKDEIWSGCSSPGLPPLYFDNIALRYSISSAPTLVLGNEETILPAPVISNVVDVDPVSLGSVADVSADISTYTGTTITSATLQILSPVVVDVPMALTSGNTTSGTWRANTYTPTQGGVYTYRIRAVASTGLSRLSPQQTFTVTDITPPVITFISIFANPILVKNTQTLVVRVIDNGALSSVRVTLNGTIYTMTAIGSNQYSYSWQVTNVGTIAYTVTATDTSSNVATLVGSFVSQPLDVDICTWKDCRQGAASWSIDDGNSSCFDELTSAGIRGTHFYSGGSTQSWFATYSAVGHEIASHTVNHPCNPPTCFPNCTEASLAALPVVPADVTSYRLNQIEPNIAVIEAGTGKPVLSLAWPCGCTDPSRWAAAQSYVLGARGYYDYMAVALPGCKILT